MTEQTIHYRKDYQPSSYQILTTTLTFDLREHETLVTNVMEMTCINPATPLVLDGQNQELFTLKLNGKDLNHTEYEWNDTSLTIYKLPEAFTLEVVSRIHPESNTSCEGLYKTNGTFCTQCEPHGFRKITFYLDRPDVMALFTTKIIADKARYPVLLSNGNLIEKGNIDKQRHYATWQDPFKKPSYLFALVAGDIAKVTDTFTTQSGRNIALEVYAQKDVISQCTYALEALKDAMRWDETRFGREYDLDVYMIYAAQDFNMGAMENKGLNVFNTKYVLTDPKLSTDKDYQMTQAVIGHEYFHNWTGNRITCRDWFQLSLKEGLTVFRDGEFTADHHDRTLKRIEDVTYMRTNQFAEDKSPMAHPIRPDSYAEMNNFYTVTVYEKGCEVIRMMHTLLDETGFRQGLDLYFKRHDGNAVTCDDFVASLADANHYDFELFKNWYSTSGTPLVKVSSHYDAAQQTYTLHFEQHAQALLHIPIRLGLLTKTGAALACTHQAKQHQEIVFSLKTKTANLVLTHVPSEPIPSLLRDFSAPVKLEYNYTHADLKTLATYDPNLFNRWDAKERLITDILLSAYQGETLQADDVVEIFKTALADPFDYPAYSAEFLNIPNLKTLAENLDEINPKKLIEVRKALVQEISKRLRSEFFSCFKACQIAKQTPSMRALKNTCLAYLGKQALLEPASHQYYNTDNMTDRLAALAAIVNAEDAPLKGAVLTHFLETYHDYPLVVDKWFLTQATSSASDTFASVKKLMKHKAFVRNNPNKVYNLVLAYANNFEAFHREDGKAYKLLSSFISEIDKKNPTVAARLTRPLMSFQNFSEPYKSLMEAELKALQALAHLSKDVSEIVNNALQGAT